VRSPELGFDSIAGASSVYDRGRSREMKPIEVKVKVKVNYIKRLGVLGRGKKKI